MQQAQSEPKWTAWMEWAPSTIRTEREARALIEQAENPRAWWRECSEATVRAHEDGYVVELGRGHHVRHVGPFATFDAAEEAAITAVRDARNWALGIIRLKILQGWSEDTPFAGATLGTAMEAIPIRIRRAPCANDELGTDAEGNPLEPPVVAIVGNGTVLRPAVAITWDDAASRANRIARYEAGMRRKQEEVQRALQQFAQKPATADLVMDKRLKRAPIVTARGEQVVLLGPVRLDPAGNAEARVGLPDRTRVWISIGDV